MARQKKTELYKKAVVEKRNVLNELRSNNMTLQELRFFSIYLSKINPWDTSTRVVRFPLEDFQRIMEFGRLNIQQLMASTDSLLCKVVHIPDEVGGFVSFTLFKKCRISRDDNGWFMEINASDDALPLMFEFKNRYFTYELWNALRLKSSNQVRMYEILKQYEKIGTRTLTIKELRALLGIAPSEYPRWQNFKVRVLDSCQQALKECTDICFTYKRGKVGPGGKWLTIIFTIQKNTDYIDQLTLEEFIDMQPAAQVSEPVPEESRDYGSELANLLGDSACNNEFNPEQVRVLTDLVLRVVKFGDEIDMCDYLSAQVNKMNLYKPKDRFGYLRKMIESDIK